LDFPETGADDLDRGPDKKETKNKEPMKSGGKKANTTECRCV